jgi:hypothetical protein
MGENGTESGDTLEAFKTDAALEEIIPFFTGDYDEAQAREWLGKATARFVYYFGETGQNGGVVTYGDYPASACGILREKHVNQEVNSPIRTA